VSYANSSEFVTFLFKTTAMEDNFWTHLLSQSKWRNAEWIMYKHEPNETLKKDKNEGDQSEWKEYRIQFSPLQTPTETAANEQQDETELKEKLKQECPQFVVL
jgi:hypothetical protein